MGRVRSFTSDDIPQVVSLRQKCFRHSAQGSEQKQQNYFQNIFFDSPWCNDSFPSLVCEEKDGTIVGFLGSLSRPISLQGEKLWMATPTQLMSDPAHRGMSGFQLMKTFLAGPQDFSLADVAASGPRDIWERLGGTTAVLQSLFWTRPLRPCRLLPRDFGLSRAASLLVKATYPLCAAMDSALAHTAGSPYYQAESELEERVLNVQGLLDCYDSLERQFSLVPEYEPATLRWLLQALEDSSPESKLRQVVLHDVDGNVVGWYLYFPSPGGVAQTVQVGANTADQGRVLQHLYHDAWKRGCLAISGRVQPEFLSCVAQAPGRVVRSGPWTLVHSRNSELLQQVCRGDAWLTRLEGEWWLNF
jgi:hypothetical protein